MTKRAPTFVEINAFLTLAEHLSFSKAAARLGVSTSTLSGTMRTLEDRLGVRLVNRSTRSVVLTAAGERLATSVKPVVGRYVSALGAIGAIREQAAGNLRIHSRPTATTLLLSRVLGRFSVAFPDIAVEVVSDASRVDIVAEHFDAGINFREYIDQDMVAVRLTDEIRTVVAASPAYFALHGTPRTPQDLSAHNCIRMRRTDGAISPWRFVRNGQVTEQTVHGSIVVNDGDLQIRAAVDGAGLIWVTVPMVSAYVEAGQLVPVLQEWTEHSDGMFLYYPGRRHVPAPLQAFVNFARADYASERDKATPLGPAATE